MASEGPTITGTGEDDATIGTETWGSPTNIETEDLNVATAKTGNSSA